MTSPIILYDIPGNAPECRAWSPNTWKVRLALNYKGLPVKTEWVEYPDIEALYKKLDIVPTETQYDGKPYYCLPVINDQSTKTIVADSFAIIQYLDKTYSETPTLLPKGTLAFHAVFLSTWTAEVQLPTWRTACYPAWRRQNARSQVYYRTTREANLGVPLEEVSSEEWWQKSEKAWSKVEQWLQANGAGADELVMGDEVCFADLHITAWILYVRSTFGADSDEWKRFKAWNGGRWVRYLERFQRYEYIDS
ncbi:hypothetical protein EIP86_002463 [Pleurotus ostreatoroseus]|nr:hypothetical protein EIP86_002463 [Pleurotus ostreatoroseus]